MSKVASAKFSALILVSGERHEIRVWVHELEPVEPGHRHRSDWVQDHLDITGCWKEQVPEGNDDEEFQLLVTGTIEEYCDYFGEHNEYVYFDEEVKYGKLPAGYFERTLPLRDEG